MKSLNPHLPQGGIKVISLGCPKNLVDTEKILGKLSPYFQPVENIEQARLVLINTCGFIEPAIEESLEIILETIEHCQKINPKPKIILTGCLVNRYYLELKKEFCREVDLILPISEQEHIAKHIQKIFKKDIATTDKRLITTPKSYAYLKISEGCNKRCSFCSIPSIRGKLRSAPLKEILKEAKFLESQNIPELVIVAQDSTSYGVDLGYKNGLIDLLDKLSTLNFKWIRLLYLYPSGINTDLLKFIASSSKVIPYFDLPLQHSHPDILKQMGRPFRQDPQKIIDKIREYLPEASLRTTFIVGFPGETENHFKHLIEFVQKNKFNHLGVFTYFAEGGTKAANLSPQVENKIKIKRKNQIMKIQKEISKQNLKYWQNKQLEIIIDKKNKEWPTLYEGRAWFQAPEIDGITYVSGESLSIGKVYQVTIEESKTYDLVGLV